MHRLHLVTGGSVARAAAWIWLAVYLVIPLACLLAVLKQEPRRGRAEAVLRPMPGWLTGVLAAEGAVLFVAGAVLFAGGLTVHHHPKSVTGFWPWALMPLSSQVIGAWLIAFGVAAALVIRERDLSRLLVSSATYTAFGVFEFVAVLWYWPQVSRHDPWLWIYLTLLAAIVMTGGYGWRAAGRQPSDHTGPDRASRATRPALARSGGPAAGETQHEAPPD
jgi:hypothetical protein